MGLRALLALEAAAECGTTSPVHPASGSSVSASHWLVASMLEALLPWRSMAYCWLAAWPGAEGQGRAVE